MARYGVLGGVVGGRFGLRKHIRELHPGNLFCSGGRGYVKSIFEGAIWDKLRRS